MDPIQASRGTRDILPDEIIYWQRIEAIARDILHRANFRELRTPTFEQTDLFERGIGEATDIVGKEMYTFQDRGDRSITLRPEGTAGAVRAYIEHNLHAQGNCQRLWYTGSMFRYERPGAGRQRQFHQLGVELLGSANPRADAEVIAIAADILRSVGITDWTLALNSLGTFEDRQQYRQALVDYFTPHRSDLDTDSQERLERNPMRILDSKDERTQAIAQGAPNILEYLGPESQQHFERVQQLLKALEIPYTLNSCLVRGLDYYTHTAFEFKIAELGTQGTLCGGGRYDRLVSELGGPDTPAVGWAIGLERLVLMMQTRSPQPMSSPDLYLVARGEEAERQAMVLSRALQAEQLCIDMDLSGSAFGKQLKRANRSGAPLCLIIGDEEATQKQVQLKWLDSGEQSTQTQSELVSQIESLRQKIFSAKSAKTI
jgi:histidyl-tRNA synthetase